MNDNEYKELYQQEQKINFRKYIYLFLSNWYWFALALFISLAAAYLTNRYTNPQYSASATIILEDKGNQGGVEDMLSELRPIRRYRRRAIVENEIAKIKSYELAQRTVEKLPLKINYTAHGRIKEIPQYEKTSDVVVHLDTSHAQQTGKKVLLEILSSEKYQLLINDGANVDTTM
ncbi:MAG: hypothetical protein ACQESJ_08970, partial [Bacteroidota bacterium]